MTEATKVSSTHLARCAFVYVRQSSTTQVERNRESTERQYRLVDRAVALGWRRDRVSVVDQDLGITGSGLAERSGFAHMIAEVALGRVGIVLGLEVSRLARNNADWYRLLDLCGATDTLIGDGDGIYHPGLFNDRLVLGLKGTMSEAELHVLRARLNGGIRNKAERGELRRGLPIGLVFGDADGEVLLDADEAVRGALQTVFDRFAEVGSARRVWLHFGCEGLLFPSRQHGRAEIRWVTPTYTKIHEVLTNPVYAGAYIYGRTKFERFVDDHGHVRKRIRKRAPSEWPVFIRDHHKGFIDWQTFEANQQRLATNTRPTPHQPGGAVREGPRCCRDSCAAVTAAESCSSPTAAVIRRPRTTAPATTSSMAGGSIACGWVAARSMRPLLARLLLPSRLRVSKRPFSSLSRSRPIKMPWLLRSSSRSNARATKRNGPNDGIEPLTQKTAWWPGASKPSGKDACTSFVPRKPI